MAKLTLEDLASLTNQTSALATMAANNTAIENAIENTLSRDGTSPNEMESNLDMNSNRIINLPAPIGDTEPVRVSDLETLAGGGDITFKQFARPEDYGVVAGLSVTDVVAEANVGYMQDALDALEATGGILVFGPYYYVFKDDGFQVPSGVTIEGANHGAWDSIQPQNPKTWEGTNIIFKGSSGADTKHNVTGITSMKYAGGWREDPSNPGKYFKLNSLMNDDATGTTPATPKDLSVGIRGKTPAALSTMYTQNWSIRNLRITVWRGTDGVSDYSNEASVTLSHPWDIGLLIEDNENVIIDNVQVVGDWREYACLVCSPGFEDYGHSERVVLRDCKFQGFTGLGWRGADQWEVSATTSNTATIKWSEESYWPTSGSFKGLGSSTATYTYSGTTRVGSDLRFDGVSPNPNSAGVFAIRNPYNGTGFAGSVMHNVYTYGLDHVSGDDSEAMGLDISKAYEMSGQPLRGIQAYDLKTHTSERVIAYLHDVTDFLSWGWQVEGGGHIIASPAVGDSAADAPIGDTRNLRIYGGVGFVDVLNTLFTPRTQYRDGDQIYPRDEIEAGLFHKALSGQDTAFELATGKKFIVRNDDETELFSVQESNGQVNVANALVGSGDLRAGANSAIYWSGRGQFRSDGTGNINARDSTNAAYATVNVATPIGDNHAATKAYVDRSFYVLGKSGVSASHTGDTNEHTFATVTIPAGAMGPNGVLRITTLWSYTNSGNNKTLRVRLGGTSGNQFLSSNVTTTASSRHQVHIHNRNSAASQIGGASGVTVAFGSTSTAVTTATQNTAASTDIVISGQLASAGETVTLEYYLVEILYGA